jgi:hypothetical protein
MGRLRIFSFTAADAVPSGMCDPVQ